MCHYTVVVMPTRLLLPGENTILLMGGKNKKQNKQKIKSISKVTSCQNIYIYILKCLNFQLPNHWKCTERLDLEILWSECSPALSKFICCSPVLHVFMST